MDMEALFETISRRRRPEDVAQMVLETLDDSLTLNERRVLDRAAAGSLKRSLAQFTSMMEDFARPVAPERQVRKAVELFSTAYSMTAAGCADAEKVEAFIRHISAEIGKTFGRSDFKSDRLNKLKRESAAIDLSKRRYNKLFRHLIRLERKVWIAYFNNDRGALRRQMEAAIKRHDLLDRGRAEIDAVVLFQIPLD